MTAGRWTVGVCVLMIALVCCVAPASGRSSARVRRERARLAAEKAAEAKKDAEKPQPAASGPFAAPVGAPVAAAVVAPVVAVAPPCDEACQQGRENLALQRKLEWFIGGLVLVGLLQVGSVTWQGSLLRRTGKDVRTQAGWMETQAGTMKDQAGILRDSVAAAQMSADAAIRQISHAVASERPWMEVQMAQKGQGYSNLKFVAKNRGSSPAKVTMYTVEKVMVSTEEVHGGPQYGSNGRSDEAQWKLAGDDFIVGEFQLPPNLADELHHAGVSVLYQGFIRYNDTVTEVAHETRFCYEAFVQGDESIRFRMFNALGYNTMS